MATKKETKSKAAPKATKAKKAVKKKEEVEEIILNAGNATDEQTQTKPQSEVKEDQPKILGTFKESENGKTAQPAEEEAKPTEEEIQAALSWREYKEGESAQEMGDRLQKEADEHKKKMEEITSIEELDKLEEEILKTLKEFDKYIGQKRYTLPTSVMFDGVSYAKTQIGDRIARALNKKEVTWQYSLGLYQLHKLWSNIRQYATIPYAAYDSTVRILGDISFKGLTEWRDILIINEFFVKPNKEFYKDSTMQVYYSTIHSQILQRKQMLTPVTSSTPVESAMKTV